MQLSGLICSSYFDPGVYILCVKCHIFNQPPLALRLFSQLSGSWKKPAMGCYSKVYRNSFPSCRPVYYFLEMLMPDSKACTSKVSPEEAPPASRIRKVGLVSRKQLFQLSMLKCFP